MSRMSRALAALFVSLSFASPAVAGTVSAVSRSAPDSIFLAGNGATAASLRTATSADGTKVVFTSVATNLVPGQFDVNGQADGFLLDRTTNTITLITHRHGLPTVPGNGSTITPIINANGTRVAFISTATDLLEEELPSDSSQRLYVYDIATATLTLVDRHLSDPELTVASFSGTPSFSANGTWLAFGSSATDLVVDQDDSNNSFDVFLYNTNTQALRLVSHTPNLFSDTTAGDGGSGIPQISADGNYIAYASSATNLISGQSDPNGGVDIFVFSRSAASNSATALVSHNASGFTQAANGASDNPTISADGSTVAFTTQGTNLVTGVSDSNGDSDVYVYDRVTRALTLVSHNAVSNTQASVMYSGNPSLSPDGRYVLHTSASADVIAGQVDGSRSDDLFVFDRTNSSLTLVSHAAGAPTTAGSNESKLGFFSGDGTRIVFHSRAENLVAGQVDTNDDDDPLLGDDVYLAELATLSSDARLISHVPGQPAVAGKRMSYLPSANLDASEIFYISESDEMPGAGMDANAATDLLLWRSATDVSVLLTAHASNADNATMMGASQVQVSRDGNWVAFVSRSPAIVAGQIDTNREDDLFLLDRATGQVRLVSHLPNQALQAGNRGVALTTSTNVSMSADGRWIAFETNASDLADGELDNNLRPDVVLFDRDAAPGTSLRLLSRKSAGGVGNEEATTPRISADGSAVVFLSRSTNLIAGVIDTNSVSDLYRYVIASSTLQLVSHTAAASTATANGQARSPAISDDGRYVAYLDSATDLVTGQSDINGAMDIFLYDAQSDSSRLITHTFGSTTTAAGGFGLANQAPVISAAGDFVVYASEGTNLVSNFQNNIGFPIGLQTQIYRWSRASDTNQLISKRPDGIGNPSGDGAASVPSVSSDGSLVAYTSAATDLIDGQQDDPLTDDAFLWSAVSGTNRLVSHLAGQPTTAAQSVRESPTLSVDGNVLVYGSDSASVASGVSHPDSQQRLYLYSLAGDVSVLVSTRLNDSHLAPRTYAERAALDATGASIVFLSPAPDVLDFDGNAVTDAFLFRRGTGVPTLTAPGDLTLPEDQVAGPLAVNVSDPDTPQGQLALVATSSDTTVLPNENIAISAQLQGYALTATPATEAAGSTTIQLTVVDPDGNVQQDSFDLTWNAVNDAPTIDGTNTESMNEDTVLGPLSYTVGDVESGPDDVVLSASSSNTGIVPQGGLVVNGTGADRTLTITPAQDAFGTVTITLTAQDPVAGGTNGVATLTLTINPVNDVPFVIAPGNTTAPENGATASLFFAMSDIETTPAQLVLSFDSTNPALLPPAAFAVTGNGAIRSLVATPLPNASGSATVTMTVADPQGAMRSATFAIDVPAATVNADLQVTVGNGRDWVTVDQPATWTIHVHNAGPDAITGARLRDQMPANVGSVSWTCQPSAGASCAPANGAAAIDLSLDLQAGADVTLLVTATPTAAATSPLQYMVTVSPAPATHEVNLSDNSATDSDALGDFVFQDGFDGLE
ncbi:Ig-like domain-containing protein [Tahibacter amnicola]|uniref:Ig-like domain-containing protein n=1 Tax=Tahibacter amnicola TaxID=2976241 RepID=A0ABY6B984_9GAMM|nr:Ig-like domain-containing protein [Tahibacter amnicola]UXI66435.1 Ig-like domain-containing protein [Tahibacter amnicola]